MSLQGLISGSECAVPSNPLSHVLKHTEGDRSLQQDRLAGPSSSRLRHLPGTSVTADQHDLALARQFFERNSQGPAPSSGLSTSHYLPPAQLGEMNSRVGLDFNEGWAMEQQHRPQAFEVSKAQAPWVAEFGSPSQLSGPFIQQHVVPQSDIQQRPSYVSSGRLHGSSPMGIYGVNLGLNVFEGLNSNYNVTSNQGKGKGKSRDADFEAAFAQVAASLSSAQTETSRIVEVDTGVANIEVALRDVTLEAAQDGNTMEPGTDFQRVWDHLQNSDLPPAKEDLAKWEAEFNQLMASHRDELDHDYAGPMQEAWEKGLGDFQEDGGLGLPLKFDAQGLPILGDYVFESNNKYLATSNSPLNDAKALLEQKGSLSEAALLFEAAIQKGDLGEGGYEAWILLGETRNMDERENAGMRALTEGVKRAEAAGAAGMGMLSLAISYTNESFDKASHAMLLRWLRARFPSYSISEETLKSISTNSSWDTHTRITDLFLDVARSQHHDNVLDPDVQIGLGVLFYTNGEYDRAKDCFESALAVRPTDYLLWNRLGSSLSNGSKPEEALGAYQEALQLRPTYTRAIYNVGVACLNIGAYKEAAEHFLSALALQESTGGGTSEQLWHTLRRAFLSMERHDLADMAKPDSQTDLQEFRNQEFDF